MTHKKSLLVGIAIGAGAAFGVREAVRRLRRRASAGRNRGTHTFMEPEGSRTRSYVPNAPGYPENLRHSDENQSWWTGVNAWTRQRKDELTERQNRYRGADALRRDINAIEFRNRNFDLEFGSESMQQRRAETTAPNRTNIQQDQSEMGRTSTSTEAELRRENQDLPVIAEDIAPD